MYWIILSKAIHNDYSCLLRNSGAERLAPRIDYVFFSLMAIRTNSPQTSHYHATTCSNRRAEESTHVMNFSQRQEKKPQLVCRHAIS